MKLRIELHDSRIEQVSIDDDKMEIKFESMVVLDVKDDFGFEFENQGSGPGTIFIRNPRFKTQPTAGEVFDGHLSQGDAKYSLLPIDMKLKSPCLVYLSQESGHHIVFGDEISVRLDK
jgi:hypothetical protein